MLRKALDKLYLWSGYAAALCLASIAVSITLQIGGRFLGLVFDATELAGMLLAATSFFGLAHTFKRGAHVRVTLLVDRLEESGHPRRLIETLCCGAATLVVFYLAYYAALLAKRSYMFNDVSPGLLAIPFWIPHSVMAAGLIILGIALTDELVSIVRGVPPSYTKSDDATLD